MEPELDENHVEIGRKDIQLACENQVEFNAWFEALEVQYRHARKHEANPLLTHIPHTFAGTVQ